MVHSVSKAVEVQVYQCYVSSIDYGFLYPAGLCYGPRAVGMVSDQIPRHCVTIHIPLELQHQRLITKELIHTLLIMILLLI